VTPLLRSKLLNAKPTLRRLHRRSNENKCTTYLLGYASATHGKQAKQLPQHQHHIQQQKERLQHILKKSLEWSPFCSRRGSVVIGRAWFW